MNTDITVDIDTEIASDINIVIKEVLIQKLMDLYKDKNQGCNSSENDLRFGLFWTFGFSKTRNLENPNVDISLETCNFIAFLRLNFVILEKSEMFLETPCVKNFLCLRIRKLVFKDYFRPKFWSLWI